MVFRILGALERQIDVERQDAERLANRVCGALGLWDVGIYPHPPNPLRPILINPNDVRFITGRKYKAWTDMETLLGAVMPGDWDLREPFAVPAQDQPYPREFAEYDLFKAFRDHFEHGACWEETERYGRRIVAARQKGAVELERVLARLASFDKLYQSIRENGYRSQLALRGKPYINALLSEIVVDIGRGGELLFVDGRHRLSIAKLLGVPQVPACVLVRHQEWMEYREAAISSGVMPDHPDLPSSNSSGWRVAEDAGRPGAHPGVHGGRDG